MKRSSILRLLSFFSIVAFPVSSAFSQNAEDFQAITTVESEIPDSLSKPASILPDIDSTYFIVRDLDDIIGSLGAPSFTPTPINKVLGPWIFSGYRPIPKMKRYTPENLFSLKGWPVLTNNGPRVTFRDVVSQVMNTPDSLLIADLPVEEVIAEEAVATPRIVSGDIDILSEDITPKWLRDAYTSYKIQEDFMYSNMISNPSTIEKAYWDLPVPPRLPEDDISFEAYMKKLDLPEIETEKAQLGEEVTRKIHWLHTVNSMLQFSQAYISSNWYQGGNNHLSLLFGFNWNVQLNQVYHPNLLFQSNLSYKLGLNSTPQDEVHSYSISEDLLQYNLNAGIKAFQKWFYSLNATFKTQVLNNYEKNSTVRKASFLSPGDFNLGLGMSYTTQNKPKTFQLTATISPLSYNLKTCIDSKINAQQFNIKPGKKSHSEFGSNGEVTMNWNIKWNINYKSRLFLFTDYTYFLSDWEHTISFDVNKFLSTQIYVHTRFDSSAESNTSWKKFMLREVLSFGLSYTFSTKP